MNTHRKPEPVQVTVDVPRTWMRDLTAAMDGQPHREAVVDLRLIFRGPGSPPGRLAIPLREGALRSAREAAGLSPGELADAVGCTRQHVWLIEAGQCRPSTRLLRAIAKQLGRPVDHFTGPVPQTDQEASP